MRHTEIRGGYAVDIVGDLTVGNRGGKRKRPVDGVHLIADKRVNERLRSGRDAQDLYAIRSEPQVEVVCLR